MSTGTRNRRGVNKRRWHEEWHTGGAGDSHGAVEAEVDNVRSVVAHFSDEFALALQRTEYAGLIHEGLSER